MDTVYTIKYSTYQLLLSVDMPSADLSEAEKKSILSDFVMKYKDEIDYSDTFFDEISVIRSIILNILKLFFTTNSFILQLRQNLNSLNPNDEIFVIIINSRTLETTIKYLEYRYDGSSIISEVIPCIDGDNIMVNMHKRPKPKFRDRFNNIKEEVIPFYSLPSNICIQTHLRASNLYYVFNVILSSEDFSFYNCYADMIKEMHTSSDRLEELIDIASHNANECAIKLFKFNKCDILQKIKSEYMNILQSDRICGINIDIITFD